jgi:hypothetical protein
MKVANPGKENGLILKDIFKILYYNEEFDPGSG